MLMAREERVWRTSRHIPMRTDEPSGRLAINDLRLFAQFLQILLAKLFGFLFTAGSGFRTFHGEDKLSNAIVRYLAG